MERERKEGQHQGGSAQYLIKCVLMVHLQPGLELHEPSSVLSCCSVRTSEEEVKNFREEGYKRFQKIRYTP